MVKKLLKNEVKRLSKKARQLKRLCEGIEEYNGKLYGESEVLALKVTALKKEMCELQKLVDVIISERPKNYGVTRIEPSRKEVMYLRVRSEGEAVAWTLLRGDALRMTKDKAAAFAEGTTYTLFKFPTIEDLEAELAELKLDSIPNDEIIGIDEGGQYGIAWTMYKQHGRSLGRPNKGAKL